MTSLLGFIGIIITLLVVVPASLIAIINIIRHPISEIVQLWLTLLDLILDIYHSIRKQYK
jgi:disulfide bond formation protein DsbB